MATPEQRRKARAERQVRRDEKRIRRGFPLRPPVDPVQIARAPRPAPVKPKREKVLK